MSFTAFQFTDSKENKRVHFALREGERLIFSYSSEGDTSYFPESVFRIGVTEVNNTLQKVAVLRDKPQKEIYVVELKKGAFVFTQWPEGLEKTDSSLMLDITEIPWLQNAAPDTQ